jgi:hypothetical protein
MGLLRQDNHLDQLARPYEHRREDGGARLSDQKVEIHKKVATLGSRSGAERLRLIGEGLPVLLTSAQELADAEKQLPREHQRARAILIGQAEEEAAKILILLDAVRCPPRWQNELNRTLSNFYNHLARLIYAAASGWHAATLPELARYVDHDRTSHYLDGQYGPEFLFRNNLLDKREGFLYADLVDEDGTLIWRKPGPRFGGIPIEHDILGLNVPRFHALPLVEALSRVGVLTQEGLKVVARIWQKFKLNDKTHRQEIDAAIQRTLETLDNVGCLSGASEQDVRRVMDWQWPMYSLEFGEIRVTEDELQRERDAAYADYV